VSGVERIDNCCVLAAVGQGMVKRKGVAATMMGALAKANVNIKALAQVGHTTAFQTSDTWSRPSAVQQLSVVHLLSVLLA
jgi:aspartokinase